MTLYGFDECIMNPVDRNSKKIESSMYILEVLCFIKKYEGDLKKNCEIHRHNMRNKYDLYTQSRNTSLLQKSVLHMGVRLHKRLPLRIKN